MWLRCFVFSQAASSTFGIRPNAELETDMHTFQLLGVFDENIKTL
jgi:hypothetical protein